MTGGSPGAEKARLLQVGLHVSRGGEVGGERLGVLAAASKLLPEFVMRKTVDAHRHVRQRSCAAEEASGACSTFFRRWRITLRFTLKAALGGRAGAQNQRET